jgi:hypothetical protein
MQNDFKVKTGFIFDAKLILKKKYKNQFGFHYFIPL